MFNIFLSQEIDRKTPVSKIKNMFLAEDNCWRKRWLVMFEFIGKGPALHLFMTRFQFLAVQDSSIGDLVTQ